MLRAALALLAKPAMAQQTSFGQTSCATLIADPLFRLGSSTPGSHWVRGYLVGRRFADHKPRYAGISGFGIDTFEGDVAWDSVRAFCTTQPTATLLQAAKPWADQVAVKPFKITRLDGPDTETGGEDEEHCEHIKAVDAIVPGHFEEIFGPWLDGFIVGRRNGRTPPDRVDLTAAWAHVNQACAATPNLRLIDAAATIPSDD